MSIFMVRAILEAEKSVHEIIMSQQKVGFPKMVQLFGLEGVLFSTIFNVCAEIMKFK